MTQMTLAADDNSHLISHTSHQKFNLKMERERLQQASSLTLPVDQELELLEQVSQFDLGCFLAEKKGLNGYWTAYIILHGPTLTLTNPLEHWVIHHAPAVLATRERFGIFQKEIQKRVTPGMTMASLPCGLMDDLLTLDYQGLDGIKLVGIDLDPDSLELAEQNVLYRAQPVSVKFEQEDAWELKVREAYDLVTSNGLNIYEPRDEKVVEFYQNIERSLRPGGIFITSFLTPPPVLNSKSPWKNYKPADVLKQKALFGDVLQVGWQSFRTEEQTRDQLHQAGFKVLDVIYDTQGMFPTVVAQKP